MPKTAAAKESEKRRVQKKKEEQRLNGISGLPTQAANGGNGWRPQGQAGPGKICADIRRHTDSGDLGTAVQVFAQSQGLSEYSHMESTVTPMLRALCQAGQCSIAAQCVAKLIQEGMKLSLKHAAQIFSGISTKSAQQGVTELVGQIQGALIAVAVTRGAAGAGSLYFARFCHLLMLEFCSEAETGYNAMMRQNPQQLARKGTCIPGVQLVGQKPQASSMEFSGLIPPGTNIQKGDQVIAQPLVGMHSEAWCEGWLTEVKPGSLTLKVNFYGEGISEAMMPGSAWRLDKVSNKTVIDRELHAMQKICQEPELRESEQKNLSPQLREVFLAQSLTWAPEEVAEYFPQEAKPPEPELCSEPSPLGRHVPCTYTDFYSQMNTSQQTSVATALGRQVTLIQGPPGTGKTHTAVGLVEQWARHGLKPVLAVADSNAGVDNLFAGMQKVGLVAVRAGPGKKGKGELIFSQMLELQSQVVAMCQNKGQTREKDHLFAQQKKMMKMADVVCCTCAGTGADSLDKHWFPAALVDEASQTTEPSVLIAMTKGIRTCAMVGDHQQLPATVLSQEARDMGLDCSLFDRLVSRGVEPALLDTQYRMHPAIAVFPSVATYHGRLCSAVPKDQRPVPSGFSWPVEGVPVAFVPVEDGMEKQVGNSYTNQVEASNIAHVVKSLLRSDDLNANDIGIITPYAEQVRVISRMLSSSVEVSTVDGFQGREKEVILVSTVRANHEGNVGFLKDRRRTNVTITRARRGLIVFGHSRTLMCDTAGLWGGWLTWAKERGLCVGFQGGEDAVAKKALRKLDARDTPGAPDSLWDAAAYGAAGGVAFSVAKRPLEGSSEPPANRSRFGR